MMIYLHDRAEIKKPKREYTPVKLPVPSHDLSVAVEARRYLDTRNLSVDLAVLNGWYPSVDFYEGLPRLVIPCQRTDGTVYWQARDITGLSPVRYTSPLASRGDAIVLVCPHGKAVVHNSLVICEGPMDALAAISTGQCAAAIALMGNNPGEAAWSHVQRYILKYEHVYVVADSDAVEIVGKIWLPKIARCANRMSLVLPRPAKDFAELNPEQRKQKLFR